MKSPMFSVIIPSYNHSNFLSDAIQSVLQQTYTDFELIIVNDGSTDNTIEVVRQFRDSRIIYIEQLNMGASAARNTGIRASSGELIAFLDADDIWHQEKLMCHFNFLEKNPEVGVSYNSRFGIDCIAKSIRSLWRPPLAVSLEDLVVSFAFGPSDMVVRRKWITGIHLFDARYVFYGDDLDFFCRLALSGCQFRSIDRALNFRRNHPGRIINDLPSKVKIALEPLSNIFCDPRCPMSVLSLKEVAFATHYIVWANFAYSQGDIDSGRELLRDAIRLDPLVLKGKPCNLLLEFILFSIDDENNDPAVFLKRILDNLPEDHLYLSNEYQWAVARANFMAGVLNILWGRNDEGRIYLLQANKLHADIDEQLINYITSQLINYRNEFNRQETQLVINNLKNLLSILLKRSEINRIMSNYYINSAFIFYRSGPFFSVVHCAIKGIICNPRFLCNRGIFSIIIRSAIKAIRREYNFFASQ
jgi:glycosyltransferase involved in cell wall biosynthesis